MSRSADERRIWAIVPAAGRGERFLAANSSTQQVFSELRQPAAPKQYTPLLDRTVIEWSLRALLAEPRVDGIVVAIAPGDANWPPIATRLNSVKLCSAVGGTHRQDTVLKGLESLSERAAADDWVMVHDAARPCLSSADLQALIAALADLPRGDLVGAVLAAPIVDTVRRELQEGIETVDRKGLWRALTPQVFPYGLLRRALADAGRDGVAVTDEAQAMERAGMRATLVGGSPFNIKVTRAEDLAVATGVLQMTQANRMRVGQGMDVHAFGEGDHVVLGGVRIAYSKGVMAHSDGDVVIHALCDALLGALGDGDIGQHFPDTDARYRGADSRVFLQVVAGKMRAAGLRLINADVTVLAEAPRIAAHRAAMAANLAEDLGVGAELINIKATTTERLGFIGRKEGLAALASVLLGP
jgi:2-C-methyl-D-erythritol 4-phosphate cytidylyltransferase / 2-C-methyl-D-erythritol 2,4-cyclodiphosphate synthase